ncbi:MAG: HAD family hydrolase [Planctomycetota bacterium]|nr:HAD family hydrolase [Planctomycetota bacterium]
MVGLVVFDVDGTLSRTSGVDDRCWCEAAREVLGVESMTTDWSCYSHSTDEAIATDLIVARFGGRPDDPEVQARVREIRDDFTARIRSEIARSPDCAHPVPGACEVFAGLDAAGWAVAIATGGWRATAELKLETAGIPFEGVPAAHADDAHPREEIISRAIERSRVVGPTVYVGDGVWDVRAATRRGIGFVGIGRGESADRLTKAGARVTLSDYTDFEDFLHAVGNASPAGSSD